MEIKAEAGTVEDALLTAAADMLTAHGWKVLVIGGTIVRGPVELPHRYELAITFVGKKRETRKRSKR